MRKFFKVITILMIIATPILWIIWQDAPNWYKGDIETCGYCGTDIWSFLWFWLLAYGSLLLWLGICAIIFIKPLIIIFALFKAHDYAKENEMYPHLQEPEEEPEPFYDDEMAELQRFQDDIDAMQAKLDERKKSLASRIYRETYK